MGNSASSEIDALTKLLAVYIATESKNDMKKITDTITAHQHKNDDRPDLLGLFHGSLASGQIREGYGLPAAFTTATTDQKTQVVVSPALSTDVVNILLSVPTLGSMGEINTWWTRLNKSLTAGSQVSQDVHNLLLSVVIMDGLADADGAYLRTPRQEAWQDSEEEASEEEDESRQWHTVL